MKKTAEQKYRYVSLIIVILVALAIPYVQADDTCMFAVTADEVPHNFLVIVE